jgi:putative tricarboxylic transport membrane protein
MLEHILAKAVEAAVLMFQWPDCLLLVAGTLIGELFGALPGLGGVVAIALLIPLTYEMTMVQAMMLLMTAQGGSAFGGSISALLINIPGESVNAATTLDGHPLAKQGKAATALGASATASALGAIFGVLILMFSIPLMYKIALVFGPPEMFALAILAITTIAAVTEGSLLKGLITAGLGVLISFIGFNRVIGGVRFTFGSDYLWDGIKLIPVVIGLFAIAQAIDLAVKGVPIADKTQLIKGSVWEGIKSVFKHKWVFLRSSVTGTLIGIIPGVGGAVANWLAYGQAVQMSKEPDTFGKGNIQGVIAPEAANDAKDGGALIPTLALGVPGSAYCAVLLGAFLVHGVIPGPTLFETQMEIIWVIIFSLIASNILTSVIGVALAKHLVKVTTIPSAFLVPIVCILSLLGAFSTRLEITDALVAFIFGIIGYFMMKYKFPRVSLLIALILGYMAEKTFFQSLQMSRGSYAVFFTRPLTLLLFATAIFSFSFPFFNSFRKRKALEKTE